MPKGRKVVKTASSVKKVNVQRKHRIGTRKAGVGANTMSTESLQEVLKSSNKSKWKSSAQRVLTARG